MARLIEGRIIASRLNKQTKETIDAMVAAGVPRPGLAIIRVGDDPMSGYYVGRKIKKCDELGICSFEYRLPADTAQSALLSIIARLNEDRVVHGILCQVPLPAHIDTHAVLGAINPAKDVDGFRPVNVGRLSGGTGGIVPCTPLGVMMLLETVVDDFLGKHAVVIGRSSIVCKPVALLLLDRECTVSVTQIDTRNLPEIVRKADIIVAAAGFPRMVKGDWVKPGAVVIDVGITRILGEDNKEEFVGDVAFDEVQHAEAISPVPGGVGPMSLACLLHNTVHAAMRLLGNGGACHDLYHDAPDRTLIYRESDVAVRRTAEPTGNRADIFERLAVGYSVAQF